MIPNTRIDLSDWLIHFVHRRNPDNDPNWLYADTGDFAHFPWHADSAVNAKFEDWYKRDAEYGLEPDALPVGVICKILHDGHLRSGWSFRRRRATIYGPRAAVCFTEMPLHALINYAALRRDEANVAVYGVCLPKHEVFAAGARPVIYGLTGKHEESGAWDWPRILAPSCGISEGEQYRYVATNLAGQKRIDWTHEREWRWCDTFDRYAVPGLPIWLANQPHRFSQALILVNTDDEAEGLLNKIAQLHDAGGTDWDEEYNRKLLANTGVICVEDVVKAVPPEKVGSLRIEDIPPARHMKFNRPEPSASIMERVQRAIERAKVVAEEAAKKFREELVAKHGSHMVGPHGFASVMLFDPQSEVTAAFLRLGMLSVYASGGYTIRALAPAVMGRGLLLWESVDAAEAASAVLEKEFPDSVFWVSTQLD